MIAVAIAAAAAERVKWEELNQHLGNLLLAPTLSLLLPNDRLYTVLEFIDTLYTVDCRVYRNTLYSIDSILHCTVDCRVYRHILYSIDSIL